MRLYVVRHAQSANNALAHPSLMNPDRDSDPSLTEVGFKQAECVARFLKEEYGAGAERCAVENRIGRLYSSPMRRCMLTSAPIARELGLDITVRGDIFEHGGCFEGSADGAVKGRPGMGTEQLEREFPGCVVPAELDKGWWKESRGVETVEEAQERIAGVVKWLWELAEASEPRDGAVCIVVHGMFIDILCKQLAGARMSVGKQSAMFCTNNAGVHAFELLVAPEGNIAGMLRFNQVDHVPVELQTGGSVDGLDECYMNEGSA